MKKESLLKFNKLTPDLMVTDVAKTVRFYTEKLGFTLGMLVTEGGQEVETDLAPDKQYVYAMVNRDEVFFMFMSKDAYAEDIPELKEKSISASATLYCDVDDVKSLYASYKENGVEIIKDLTVTWYGMQEFYIKDCNGYILGFASKS
ncbi:MAG: VOC family protein [bacterium]